MFSNTDFIVNLQAGISTLTRDRHSRSYVFEYGFAPGSFMLPPGANQNQNISQVLSVENFVNNTFQISSTSNAEANYVGNWDLTAMYLQPSFEWIDKVKATVGFRQEDSKLEINTAIDPFSQKVNQCDGKGIKILIRH